MDAVECTNWMERTRSLPKYISADVAGRYYIAYEKVEERLRMCRVEGLSAETGREITIVPDYRLRQC